jgi:hypothetical protein
VPYNKILESLPSKRHYKEIKSILEYKSASQLNEAIGSRYDFWLIPDNNNYLNEFWSTFCDWISSTDVINTLYSTYYKDNFIKNNLKISARLVREEDICYIESHLDKPFKIITIVVYLDDTDDSPLPGTILFSQDNTEKEKYIKYSKNTGLVIINSLNSWHRVDKTPILKTRNTLHIYIKDLS